MTRIPFQRFSVFLLLLLAITGACSRNGNNGGVSSNLERGCAQAFDPDKDYFPDKAVPEFARNFSVEYHRSYKVVTVHQASLNGGPETYVLLQCGAPRPALDSSLQNATIIQVPITSLFSESTTHDQPLIDLGRDDVLTGVSEAKYVTHPQIVERIKAGKIIDFAPGGALNAEQIIASAPSILLSSRNDDPAFAAVRTGGVPVVVYGEWLEQSALGRTEWIKFLSLFLNEEQKAGETFNGVRDEYLAWKQRTQNLRPDERPKVTTGGVFRGNYLVAGGRSYAASLIADAGGDYVFAGDQGSGSQTLDLETGIARAANADFWINGGPFWPTLQAMLAEEPRYSEFKAWRTGQVWLYNRPVNPDGSNDYWARGASHPDLILADLIKVFHPDLAKDHEFNYYMAVPGKAQ